MSAVSGYRAPLTSSQCIGGPTLMPGLTRPPDSTSTVARSSASRSGFSQPSGVTAVPSSIRRVRWLAAAITATGEEMPYCRCRCRTQALSKPSRSPSSMTSSVDSCPGRGSSPSNRPMVRKPSLRSGLDGSGTVVPSDGRDGVGRSLVSGVQVRVRPGADDACGTPGLVLSGEEVVGALERHEAARVPRGPEDLAGVGNADGGVGGSVHHQERSVQGADPLVQVGTADVLDEVPPEGQRLASDQERSLPLG